MAEDFEKIRRNVQKMVAAQAPEADIDGYLATERLSPDEFKRVATGKAKLGDIRMTQRSAAAMQPPVQPPMSRFDAGTAAFAQGALFDYGDEMIGGIEALKSGFEPGVYTKNRDEARQFIE